MPPKISKPDAEWRGQLTDMQYHVTREKAPERAFPAGSWASGPNPSSSGSDKATDSSATSALAASARVFTTFAFASAHAASSASISEAGSKSCAPSRVKISAAW